MQNLRQHIAFKIAALVLVVALLGPTLVRFSHSFAHHKHEICQGERQSHVHSFDVDCNFNKFKLNNTFALPKIIVDIAVIPEAHDDIHPQYFFLSQFQPLHYALRAPPLNDLV